MRLWLWSTLAVGLLFIDGVISKGSKGGGRGSSGARSGASSGGSSFGSSGNRSPSSGVFAPAPRGNTFGSSNTGSKSGGLGGALGSNKVKAGLAAAAAGYITYKAGKKVLSAGSHFFSYGGRPYYFGPTYYNQYGGLGPGMTTCSYFIRDDDFDFKDLFFPDNQRMDQLYFSCPVQMGCCGLECCQVGQQQYSPVNQAYQGNGWNGATGVSKTNAAFLVMTGLALASLLHV